ncbi:MAG: hypothetical protein ACQETI_00315 [Halobacteriota archaeon]
MMRPWFSVTSRTGPIQACCATAYDCWVDLERGWQATLLGLGIVAFEFVLAHGV